MVLYLNFTALPLPISLYWSIPVTIDPCAAGKSLQFVLPPASVAGLVVPGVEAELEDGGDKFTICVGEMENYEGVFLH